jgi:hypothetical protein
MPTKCFASHHFGSHVRYTGNFTGKMGIVKWCDLAKILERGSLLINQNTCVFICKPKFPLLYLLKILNYVIFKTF